MTMPRRTFTLGLLAAGAGLATLARARAAEAGFPVTIVHALGESVVAAAPKRIVTIGWMAHDAATALGHVPVGMPRQSYGGDADGLPPWLHEELDRQGAALPERLDFTSGVPFEAILALAPDLVLAPYSGIGAEDYARLSSIAPTIAYAREPWVADWQELTRTVATATGTSADGKLAALAARLAAVAAAHPEFAGKTFVLANTEAGRTELGLVVGTDPRIAVLEQLGFVLAPGVAAMGLADNYNTTISFERLGDIDADMLLSWDDGTAEDEALLANPLLARYRPVAAGRHLRLTDEAEIMALSAPSLLAIPWVLERIVPKLAALLA
jgi:iron complex transport system substrate-binding protein